MTKYIRVQNKLTMWTCPNCKERFQFKCERASKIKQKLHGNKCMGKPIKLLVRRTENIVNVYHS